MNYIDTTIDTPSYTHETVQYTQRHASIFPIRITRNNNDEYALLMNNEESNVIYLFNGTQHEKVKNVDQTSVDTFNVNDCVVKCQNVIGLKINEIAKLTGVSRATLDLHRKGANVKDMDTYHKLYSFVTKIEQQYGNSIKHSIRNVLVGRQTLLQHFVKNRDDLECTLPLISEVSEKLLAMNVVDTDMDASKSNRRLSRIGKSM